MPIRRSRFRKPTKLDMAFLLVLVGVVGRLLLVDVANVETVLAASMLAGVFLGWRHALLVSISVMMATDAVIYAMGRGNPFGLFPILGLTAFTWSGMVFAGIIGSAAGRRRILFTTRSMALLTVISIPATILYDVWTAFGDWVFLAGPRGVPLETVYLLQIPFTLVHIASSIIFVPLFGSIFAWLTPTPESLPLPEAGDHEPSKP